MRTSIDLQEQALAWAKAEADQTGRRLSDVVNDVLLEHSSRRQQAEPQEPYTMGVYGGGIAPAVDMADGGAAQQAMDEERRDPVTVQIDLDKLR